MSRLVIKMITWGGLGDVLLTTPSFQALKRKHPGCKIEVYCVSPLHEQMYRHNPYIDSLRDASFRKNMVSWARYYLKLDTFYKPNYGSLLPSRYYTTNATGIIAEMLDVTLEGEQMAVFLTESEEQAARRLLAKYPNPVAMHITSHSSANLNWPRQHWEELVQAMPEVTFLQLGAGREEKVEGAIDLRGRTSIRESLALVKQAASFVGVASFMSHASAAVGTPGVVLFGPSTPRVWGHEGNVNLFKGTPCAPCLDLLERSPCPYNQECMTGITVAEVAAALRRQLHQAVPMPASAASLASV